MEKGSRGKMGVFAVFRMLLLIVVGLFVAPLHARDILYCNSMNTGSDSKVTMTDDFQSHGLCFDFCVAGGKKGAEIPQSAKFAFAVVRGFDCWCTDYAPDPEKEADGVDKCNHDCPGYDQEKCGSMVEELFGYIRLAKLPSGTKGLPKPTKTTSPPETSSTDGVPQLTTVTVTEIPSPTDSPTPPTTDPPTATDSDAPAPSDSQKAGESKKSFFDETGKVIGTFVGVAIAVGLLILALLIFIKRRRDRRGSQELPGTSDSPVPGAPGGVLPISERRQSGRMLLPLGEKGFHRTVLATTPEIEDPERRPVHVDQRLDPNIWTRNNHSRLSVRSLRDDHDYSRRVLKVTNADPDTS